MKILKQFGNGITTEYGYVGPIKNNEDLSVFLHEEAFDVISKQLHEININVKYTLYVKVRLCKFEGEDVKMNEPWFSNSEPAIVYNSLDIENTLLNVFSEIETKFDYYVKNGSGFFFDEVLDLSLLVSLFRVLSGAKTQVPILPVSIRRRRGIHIFNEVDKEGCFLQCIRYHLRKRKPMVKLRTSTIDNPTSIDKIESFEIINNLSIYVFGSTLGGEIFVNYISKNQRAKTTIDLLLYDGHYFYVEALTKLVYKKDRGRKTHICRSCLCFLKSKNHLRLHKRFCDNKGTIYTFPSEQEAELKFDNYRAMVKNPHIVYFDTECYIDKDTGVHHPIAVGAKRVCVNSTLNSELFTYFGDDCIKQFLRWLEIQKETMREIDFHHYLPLKMTPENWSHYRKQETCEMCGDRFVPNSFNKKKCADHDHLTGEFRFALCNDCNLTYAARETTLTIACHCSMKYDAHLLVTEIAELARKNPTYGFKTIPKNRENNLVIYYGPFIFIDSYQFLQSSLGSLAETMTNFPLVKEQMGEKNYQLFTRKGVFCYDYIDSPEKLQEDRLPEQSEFYDSLAKKSITDKEYQHAQRVWDTMGCETLLDYTRIYLETDVLILADCFEQFRTTTMQNFGLDPSKFLSTPHLGFNSMLKYTGVKLGLLQDQEMVDMVKGGIRGGVSVITKRYAQATESSQIVYLDCSNLYGFALSKPLPVDDFRWMTNDEINSFDVTKLTIDSKRGYMLECDLGYPSDLHEKHNDLPLAPEKIVVNPEDWSPYSLAAAKTSGVRARKGTCKLVSHLGPRRHYVLHYLNLKFYLEQGMVLEKIHRGLSFTQSKWMKPFIDFTTEQRKLAKSVFHSNFWKLISNSAYGKLLQDPSKYNNLQMVSQPFICRELVSKPTFKRIVIYNKRFVGIENKREFVLLNKPIIAGFAVLELSKLHVYKFHYLYMKRLYGDKCELLMTDTDSLIYEVNDPDFDRDTSNNRQYFDLSNYPPENPLYDPTNKKLRGTFKNEFPHDPVLYFVGVRSKMYVTLHESQCENKKAKGLPKSVVAHMKFDEYLKALNPEEEIKHHTFRAIRSNLHVIRSADYKKKGLSPFDDKRYVLSDGIHTLAHGHRQIKEL